MSKIDKIINKIKMEIEYHNHPGGYQDMDYYSRCEAKVDILEDVLYYVEQVKEGNY